MNDAQPADAPSRGASVFARLRDLIDQAASPDGRNALASPETLQVFERLVDALVRWETNTLSFVVFETPDGPVYLLAEQVKPLSLRPFLCLRLPPPELPNSEVMSLNVRDMVNAAAMLAVHGPSAVNPRIVVISRPGPSTAEGGGEG